MADTIEWQTPAYRSKIINKFEEEIKSNPTPVHRTSAELEEFAFNKARSRDEYLDTVARLLLTVTGDRSRGMQNQAQNPALGIVSPSVSQDPIDALQSLTGQASSGMTRQQPGMIHRMAPTRPGAMVDPSQMHHRQAQQPQMQHMQHVRGQMQQQPPQLTRQNAFIVTSPQTVPGVQGQPFPTSNTNVVYPNQAGPIRSMGPNNMPHQYMPQQQARDVGMAGMPIASPAQGSPLSMMPSPQGSAAVRPHLGAPSPSTMLHTPGTAVSDPSPGPPNTSQEELAYVEKLNKLSRYIEPLRKSAQEYEKKSDEESIRYYTKVIKLLDVLSNRNKRVPYAVLERCEQVLVKQTVPPSTSPNVHMCQSLLDMIARFSSSSCLNHSLYRTFGPALETYMGPPIKAPSPPPVKKAKVEKDTDSEELPDNLQGEIARLSRHFQVSVDSRHHLGSHSHHLVCRLEEPQLPSVPPLLVTIPKTYPRASPECSPKTCPGYDATEFFQNVELNLSTHLSNMPNRFCLTQLLTSWEMSVRKACDPESPLLAQVNPIFAL